MLKQQQKVRLKETKEYQASDTKFNVEGKPKFAKEKIKKNQQKNGIMVTIRDNKNVTRLVSSYNIPLLKIKQKMIAMSICNNIDPVKLINLLQKWPTRKFM